VALSIISLTGEIFKKENKISNAWRSPMILDWWYMRDVWKECKHNWNASIFVLVSFLYSCKYKSKFVVYK
jgi:hypothetical protein